MKARTHLVLAGLAVWALSPVGAIGTAHAAEPLVIGQSLPLQGSDLDGRGPMTLAGSTAYVEAINARGGIGGRLLKLVTLNDDNDPQRHAQNLRRLSKDHKVVAFANCLGDASCAAAATVATDLRVPLVGVHAGARNLSRAQNPHVFRIRAGYDKEADAIARQIKALGLTRMALVTDANADAEQVAVLQAAFVRHGVQATLVQVPRATPEALDALLAQLAKGNFQAATLDLRADVVTLIVDKGLDRRSEWPTTLMSLANGTLNLLRGNFPNSVIGFVSVVPDPDRGALALTQELQRAADVSGGPVATSLVGFESFIGIKVCAEGLRRAGSKPDAERLFETLDAMTDLDLGGYRVSFNRSRTSGSDFVDVGLRRRLKAL